MSEFKFGDIVVARGSIFDSMVTNVSGNKVTRLFRDGSCDSFTNKEELRKIGHFDSIDAFIRIGEYNNV